MATSNTAKNRVGEIRPSQLLRDFGVGALVDLPNISAIVLGLEDWEPYYQQPQEVSEERLLMFVRWLLGQQVARLRTPPVPIDSNQEGAFGASSPVGVPIAAFPRWMVCSYCRTLASVESGLFQLKPQFFHPERTAYVHTNCSKPGAAPTVQPARFLTACKHGHLDDFPWLYYVHKGNACEAPRLTLRETGFSSNITEVRVKCESCGASRAMSDAFGDTARKVMPLCHGRRPHLRDYEDDGCDEQMSTLLLGASNTWFPVLLRALSIPKAADPLADLVDRYWPRLAKATSEQNVELMLSLGDVIPLLSQFTASAIWAEVEARQTGQTVTDKEDVKDLKAPEWRALSRGNDITGHPYFYMRNVKAPPKYGHLLERVALVERLREVDALVGFTRLASLGDLAEENDATDTEHLPFVHLSRKQSVWVPAFEVHGEGIFLQFHEDTITDWLQRSALRQRERAFRQAHIGWRARRHMEPHSAHFPGLRYVLLHSFAHALMRQLSLEAGYSMASLCERIYARNSDDPGGPMAGILLYTAAPDSEGTLGGLVSLGAPERLSDHIHGALESIRWCASDPLCASNDPRSDSDHLYGAACHACLFAPETSCERGNRYLDRSLLLPTMEHTDMAFFADFT